MFCSQTIRQGINFTGNSLYSTANFSWKLSNTLLSSFKPQQRLPHESKVSHCAREIFAFLGKVMIASACTFTIKTLSPVAIPIIGVITGLTLCSFSLKLNRDEVKQRLPERIQEIASPALLVIGINLIGFNVAAFAMRFTLTMCKHNFVAAGCGFIGAKILAVARNNNPADVCIESNAQSLDAKLDEMLQARRKIKGLEIKNEGPIFTLSQTNIEKLQKIQADKISLNGVQLSNQELANLNKACNQDPQAKKMKFYFFAKADETKHQYILDKADAFPHSCALQVARKKEDLPESTSAEMYAKIKSYLEQFRLTKNLHWPSEKTSVIFNSHLDEPSNVNLDLHLFQLIKALDPESIDFQNAIPLNILEALNCVSNAAYYCNANGTLKKTQLGESYFIGYGEKLTNETIKTRLESIRGQNIQSIVIYNHSKQDPKSEELVLNQEVIDLLREMKPISISLKNCKITKEQLISLSKSLNQHHSTDSIFIYTEQRNYFSRNQSEIKKVEFREGYVIHKPSHAALKECAEIVQDRAEPISKLILTDFSDSELDDQTISYLTQISPRVMAFKSGTLSESFLQKLLSAFPKAVIEKITLSFNSEFLLRIS